MGGYFNTSLQHSYNELLDIKDCVPDFYVECLIALWMWRTVPPVLVFIGTCGNILNIIILSNSRLRKYSTSIFLISLAIVELLFLWVSAVPVTIHALTSIQVQNLGEVSCRLRMWIGQTCGAMSVWLLVLLNIERILLVKAPIFSRTKVTPTNALITTCITLAVIATLNTHFIFGMTIKEHSSNSTHEKMCYFRSEEYKHFIDKTWSVYLFVLFTLLPFCIIFIGNINIAKVLITRRKRLAAIHPTNEQVLSNNEKRKSSTLLLFILCTFFLITIAPYCIYLILKGNVQKFEGRSLARWQLANSVVSALITSNAAFNFFFYFVSGTLFKQEWKRLATKAKEKFKTLAGIT